MKRRGLTKFDKRRHCIVAHGTICVVHVYLTPAGECEGAIQNDVNPRIALHSCDPLTSVAGEAGQFTEMGEGYRRRQQ